MVSLDNAVQPDPYGPASFSCRSTPLPGRVHVVPRGELDIATVPQLDRSLRIAAAAENEVILDLRELEFIDCTGGQLLIAASRHIARLGGRLRVIDGTGEVAWLLELAGIDRELDLIEAPEGGD
jgi:stage II sporulation protein AA (anti-sigma F factor antagonist)